MWRVGQYSCLFSVQAYLCARVWGPSSSMYIPNDVGLSDIRVSYTLDSKT